MADFSVAGGKIFLSSVVEIEGIFGFFGSHSGTVIALRENGDEALFVSKDNAPLEWIPTKEFTADPLAFPTPEELRKEAGGSEEEYE